MVRNSANTNPHRRAEKVQIGAAPYRGAPIRTCPAPAAGTDLLGDEIQKTSRTKIRPRYATKYARNRLVDRPGPCTSATAMHRASAVGGRFSTAQQKRKKVQHYYSLSRLRVDTASGYRYVRNVKHLRGVAACAVWQRLKGIFGAVRPCARGTVCCVLLRGAASAVRVCARGTTQSQMVTTRSQAVRMCARGA